MRDVGLAQHRVAPNAFVCGRIAGVGLILSIVLVLSGCSLSPSNADLEQALVGNDPLVGKIYSIRNVRRVNGYEQSQGYVIEYTAEIYILESPTEYFGHLAKSDSTGVGAFAAFGLATAGLAKWGALTAAAIAAGKKGDVLPFSGTVTMIKSERGWILQPD